MPLFSNLLFINWDTEHDCRYHNCWGPFQFPHIWRSEEGSPWGVPGRESNMGLPHSRPTRYCLSCAAPLPELRRILAELHRTLSELRCTLAELRSTLSELRRTLSELRRTLSELRRTQAELQSTLSELRRTLSELRRTLSDLGTPHPTELHCTLLSYAAAYWAMPHPT